MTRTPLVYVCLLLALAGAALCGSLLRVHATGSAGILSAVCGDEGGGCGRVVGSRWSVFPPGPADGASTDGASGAAGAGDIEGAADATAPAAGGIPVAALGLFYFSALAVWFLAVGVPAGARRGLHAIVVLVCVTGCLVSIAYIAIMATAIKAWCPLCLAAHVVNFALLPAVIVAGRRTAADEPDAAGSPKRGRARRGRTAAGEAIAHPPAAVLGLTLLLVAAVWWAEWSTYRAASLADEAALARQYANDADMMELAYFQKEQRDIDIREDDPIIPAKPGTRMTVLYFSQPQCPHCALFEEMLFDEVVPAYNGHLRIVYKHFPPSDPNGVPFRASTALEAARLQGKFWEMHELLGDRRNELPRVDYGALAAELGLDVERFLRDMESDAVRERIQEDIAQARKLGVRGTPGVFLNSRLLDRLMRDQVAFYRSRADRLKRSYETSGREW